MLTWLTNAATCVCDEKHHHERMCMQDNCRERSTSWHCWPAQRWQGKQAVVHNRHWMQQLRCITDQAEHGIASAACNVPCRSMVRTASRDSTLRGSSCINDVRWVSCVPVCCLPAVNTLQRSGGEWQGPGEPTLSSHVACANMHMCQGSCTSCHMLSRYDCHISAGC